MLNSTVLFYFCYLKTFDWVKAGAFRVVPFQYDQDLMFFLFFGAAGIVIRMTNSTHGGNVGGRQCQTSTD